MKSEVLHYVSLSGVGGVERHFAYYYNIVQDNVDYEHMIFSPNLINRDFYKIKRLREGKSFSNNLYLLKSLVSKNVIVNFHNNYASKKMSILLRWLPVNKIILHEQGTVWNADIEAQKYYEIATKRADIIIANSQATKTMLNKKFNVDDSKIKVLHNVVPFKSIERKSRDIRNKVGFIGRLDTPKGVHVLIEAAKKLSDIEIYIAGSGPLEENLKKQAIGHDNIHFLGNIEEHYEFIASLDILVVPSIREPLGNVVIEAGICKTPVIAANIDGIAEIITDRETGILIQPKHKITLNDLPSNAVPLPAYVVDPRQQVLVKPMEIDSQELAISIKDLLSDNLLQEKLAINLYNKIKTEFSADEYIVQMNKVYNGL